MRKSNIIILFFSLLIGLCFTSCENFLKGSNVREELAKSIDYANATRCTLYVSALPETGSFLSAGEKECRVGYAIDLQFTVNSSSYIFKGVKAVSTQDNLSSRNDFVAITTNPVEGIADTYIITIKLLKAANDILIIPDCSLIPKVTDFYPPYNPAGYEQDTTIRISFNKKVDPEYFKNFNHIKISDNSRDLIHKDDSFFEEPYFSDDNTVLNIPTVKTKRIIETTANSENSQEYKDLTVTIDLSNLKDEEGNSFELCSPHVFRVNIKIDNESPVLTEIKLFSTSDNQAYYYRELNNKPFDQWEAEDFHTNHISKVYMSLKGTDNLSGIKGIYVKEYFLQDENCSPVPESEQEKSKDIYGESTVVKNIDGSYSINLDYSFKSEQKGLVKLVISLKDNADNESVLKEYYVLLEKVIAIVGNVQTPFVTYISSSYSLDGSKIPDIPIATLNDNTGVYEYTTIFRNFTFTTETQWGDNKSNCKIDLIAYNNKNITDIFKDKQFTDTVNIDLKEELNTKLSELRFDSDYPVFLYLSVYDECGLNASIKVSIPEAGRIGEFNEEHSYTLRPKYSEDNWTFYKFLLYRYKAKNEDEWSDLQTITFDSVRQTQGIYEIYVLNFISIDMGLNQGSYRTACALGKPSYYYNGVDSPADPVTSLPSFTLPAVSALTYEKNSGTAKGTVSIDYPNDGNTYLMKFYFHKDDYPFKDSKLYMFEGKEFEIENGRFYTVSVVANSPQGIFLGESEEVQYNLTYYDNFPPRWENLTISSYINPNSVDLYQKPNDVINSNSGKITQSGTIKTIDYYFVPFYYGKNLSDDVLKTFTKKTHNIADSLELPFDGIDYGKYNVFLYYKDSSGNDELSIKEVEHYITDIVPEVDHDFEFSEEDEIQSVIYTISFPKYSDEHRVTNIFPKPSSSAYIAYQYLNGKKWLKCSDYNAKKMTLNDEILSYSFNSTAENFSNKWIKIIGRFEKPNSVSKCIYTKSIYLYPDYALGNIRCDSTSYTKTANGYQVFCDAPCFVHTMYCSKKLSETTTMADIYEWESRGIETGVMTNNHDFTYKNELLSDIKQDMYYTTIFHFANGTTYMTEVQQMK